MTKGRKLLFSTKLKPNGLLEETDSWYHQRSKELGITCAELKRTALEQFKQAALQEKPTVEALT